MVNEKILAAARERALREVDRNDRVHKIGMAAVFLWEVLLVVLVVALVDFSDPLHRLVLVATGMLYASLALGLTLLGAYVKRQSVRTLAAIHALVPGSDEG